MIMSFSFKSQTNLYTDSTKLYIPYYVVQKILLDLNDYDRLKELSILDKQEILELNNKIILLEKTNDIWIKKDSLNFITIKNNEEKFNIVDNEIKDLKKENKRLKTKNGLFNIISAIIIAPLTYLVLFK